MVNQIPGIDQTLAGRTSYANRALPKPTKKKKNNKLPYSGGGGSPSTNQIPGQSSPFGGVPAMNQNPRVIGQAISFNSNTPRPKRRGRGVGNLGVNGSLIVSGDLSGGEPSGRGPNPMSGGEPTSGAYRGQVHGQSTLEQQNEIDREINQISMNKNFTMQEADDLRAVADGLKQAVDRGRVRTDQAVHVIRSLGTTLPDAPRYQAPRPTASSSFPAPQQGQPQGQQPTQPTQPGQAPATPGQPQYPFTNVPLLTTPTPAMPNPMQWGGFGQAPLEYNPSGFQLAGIDPNYPTIGAPNQITPPNVGNAGLVGEPVRPLAEIQASGFYVNDSERVAFLSSLDPNTLSPDARNFLASRQQGQAPQQATQPSMTQAWAVQQPSFTSTQAQPIGAGVPTPGVTTPPPEGVRSFEEIQATGYLNDQERQYYLDQVVERARMSNPATWTDWGEGSVYQGQPFGALGAYPYPGPNHAPYPPQIEQWRPLVSQYFNPADVDKALWVMSKENATGNPAQQQYGGPAVGLFQIEPGEIHPGRPSAAELKDPVHNVRYAALMAYSKGRRV